MSESVGRLPDVSASSAERNSDASKAPTLERSSGTASTQSGYRCSA
ncbi:hypothetical protein [Halostagnicola sp. A56]|nr:hypothetical protein [Halostagnicola sp. A56]